MNQRTYASADVVRYYAGLEELFPTEKKLFEKLSAKIQGSKILDLGIGGGRTTGYLLPIAGEYIGLDYVASFIEIVNRKYEKGIFVVGDARDLSQFEDERFDFVLFSYNGIDTLSPSDRMSSLSDIFRVLRRGGTFMFSSHNRDYRFFRKPYWLRHSRLNWALVRNLISYLIFLPRHIWMKRLEVFTDEFVVINDSDHRYSLLIYYITIAAQKKQLRKIGFVNTTAYSESGNEVMADRESFWIYYVAQK